VLVSSSPHFPGLLERFCRVWPQSYSDSPRRAQISGRCWSGIALQWELVQSVRDVIHAVSPEVLSGRLREVLKCDETTRVSGIRWPILYVQADEDHLVRHASFEVSRQETPISHRLALAVLTFSSNDIRRPSLTQSPLFYGTTHCSIRFPNGVFSTQINRSILFPLIPPRPDRM
jgi:hypothetical protein